MEEKMAFTGSFVAFKHIATRNAFQFIIEVDEQMADECLRRIGGLPRGGMPRSVAVAVLDIPKEAPGG